MQRVPESGDCCINSKFSAAQKGYFQDDFLSLCVKKGYHRSPVINRGYYIRFKAIEEVFLTWWPTVELSSSQKFQIISLGAGYDSSYLRLSSNKQLPPSCHYVEIDFPDVMKRKYELIKDALSPGENVYMENSSVVFCNGEYSMLGADLTNMPVLQKCLKDVGIDTLHPTLFLSECSITYVDPSLSECLISWAAYHFVNSIFVAYEQVYPDDAFGLIMRNHFTQVGCPLKSIMKYPDEKSQCKRFRIYHQCRVITMYDFYNSLPCEEKQRIQQLELFDEYEMWHEKCHHYILLWACQGVFVDHLPPFLTIKSDDKHVNIVKTDFNWKTMTSKSVFADEISQRFGHQVLPISSSVIMISGGFGTVNKKHQRLRDVSLYDIESKEYFKIPFEDQKLKLGNRMLHTMSKLANNTVVILGGRSSPKKVFDEVLVLHNCCLSTGVKTDTVSSSNKGLGQHLLQNHFSPSSERRELLMPVPTWRHSASVVDIEGTESIVVFGGCSHDEIATNNCSVLNTETWKWSKINVQDHTPCPRHSHSAVVYKKNMVIVTGGLTEDETILNSVHLFNAKNSKWSDMPVSGLLPRYSHTSHIWKDFLFLVGGVTNISHFKLGIAVVNLKTLQAFEIQSPAQDPEFPILLCNHSSYIQEDEIFIIGGGGNCFSFGTHFNKKIVSFNVNNVLNSIL